MKTADEITDQEIEDAEVIATSDPVTGKGHQLWGQDVAPAGGNPDVEAKEIKPLHIELKFADKAGLLALIQRIEKIRGRIPQEIQQLRNTLTTS